MLQKLAFVVVLCFAIWSPVAAEDPIFDVPVLIATPLNPRTLKTSERDGIVTEEVQFHSERDGDKDVEIFAFFSYPKGARGLPAYIWNPGGLGQASPAYTEQGARRGYATLCIDFPQPGYRSTGGYPINTGLFVGTDPRQAPIYHGAVALLKAVSYLESRSEVDKDRIGMAGSSWGGFFTTLMIGIDPRLKAGSCLYGTGNLQLGNAWWDGDSKNGNTPPPPAERERWRKTLDPAWRLPTKKTPLAWITGTNDKFYCLSGVMATYDLVNAPRQLTLVPNWDHALPSPQYDAAYFNWLDVHLQGKPAPPVVTPVTVRNENGRLIARWSFEGEASAADLIASFGESGNWAGRFWHVVLATIEGQQCRAEVPAGKLVCFISGAVTTKEGVRSSTPLAQVEAAKLGVAAQASVPDYDGCQEWGGFEERHIAYLDRHTKSGQTRWVPRLSNDAKEGNHSAILEAERTILPPILSTTTVPHRLTAFLKAEKPARIALQLASDRKEFEIGTEWTVIKLEHTPQNDVMGGLPASILIPSGATVLIDAIEFHPISLVPKLPLGN